MPSDQFNMEAISPADIVDTVRTSLLVLDGDLTVRSANRAFFQTFAVPPEETIGRPLFALGDGQWDISDLRVRLHDVVPEGAPIEAFEVEQDFPGVGHKIVLINARKVFRVGNHVASLLLAIDDVTEARDAQREAERNAQLAQNIVDTIRDPLVVLDGDLTVATASRAFLRLFDVPADQVLGHSLAALGHGQWKGGKLRDLLTRIIPEDRSFDGFEVEDDFTGLGRRIFKLNARKIHRPGNHVTRLLLVFEDVTEARRLERNRDLLAAELAHRIKNSLQIITAFVSFEIRRAAKPCVAGYRAMQARIGAVAQLYDVISRSATLGPVEVTPYLDGIGENLRASLLGEASDIEVTVSAEPLTIDAEHAVTLGLIVNELATNAIKYAFPSGRGRVQLGLARQQGAVILTVSDDGIGMAGAGAGSDKPTSGLGSRFVEAFVRQIGGTLAAATGPAGTTFTVRLPDTVLADA